MSRNRQHQLPIADIRRRLGAAAIDFTLVWLTTSLIGSALGGATFIYWFSFLACWYVLRVFVVLNNQGQSPGHWALDMKVVQEYTGRMPRQEWMLKREGMVGFTASLILVGLQGQSMSALIFVLVLPIGFDFWLALTDRQFGQTFHDRWGRTVVINTLRGYSLDVKVLRWVDEFRARRLQSAQSRPPRRPSRRPRDFSNWD